MEYIDLIGFGHTPFGRRPHCSVQALMQQAAQEALNDAGFEGADIDAVVISHFNHGFSEQGFTAGLSAALAPGLQGCPAIRVESACASGAAAVHVGAQAILSGRAQRVLVIGVEAMTHLTSVQAGRLLLKASHVDSEADTPAGFAGLFARAADAYAKRFADPSMAMARIAHKNLSNGAANSLAHFRRPMDLAACSVVSADNPHVMGRLKLSDCSPISDGAAAIVMSHAQAHSKGDDVVSLRAMAQFNDFLPLAARDASVLHGAGVAWRHALSEARVTLNDIDCVETHDCFSIAELMQYEAMGLTGLGEGARALEEGWVFPDGRLPINLSGGLKSKGHPIGATGVSMHVMASRQLLGRYGTQWLKSPELAGVFNMGGAGVANLVSILERVK